jgi:hypothetical protein
MVPALLVIQHKYIHGILIMNNRKAKLLRRRAMANLYLWYLTMLDENQQEELTPELAAHYTPKIAYWEEKHERIDKEGRDYISIQRHVSEHTHRWFIQREKLSYASMQV